VIARYIILRRRIESELDDVRRAVAKAEQAFQRARRSSQDSDYYLDSVAINLHGFYNGVERIFEGIAREIDGGLPEGPNWHRGLLGQMTLDVATLRPAVLRRDTAARLDEYLRFRHLVRNLYTWNFEADKLGNLVTGLPGVLNALAGDLAAFSEFLEAASHVDTSSPAQL